MRLRRAHLALVFAVGVTSCGGPDAEDPTPAMREECVSAQVERSPSPAPNSVVFKSAATSEPGATGDPGPIRGQPAPSHSPQAAATIVETYYALLGAGRYDQAYRLWSGDGRASGRSVDAFRRSFQGYRSYAAEVDAPSRVEGAAGSLYVTVPVRVSAVRTDGVRTQQSGTVTLRRVNDVPGSTAEQRRWYIARIELEPARVPAGKLDRVYAYRCRDGRNLVVRFEDEAALIERAGAPPLRLPQQPSGSGFRYAGEAVAIRGKGRDLTVEADEQQPGITCTGEPVTAR